MNNETRTINMYYDKGNRGDSATTFDWMIDDLYRGVQTQSNYLVALGLVSYSEAIGRVILNDINHSNWECFKTFTSGYIGYTFLTEQYWARIRNGLAHMYFINYGTDNTITIDESKKVGIEINGKITININIYFNDFVNGVKKYLAEQANENGTGYRSVNFGDFSQGRGFTGPPPPNDINN